jgi:peroxiredoxin
MESEIRWEMGMVSLPAGNRVAAVKACLRAVASFLAVMALMAPLGSAQARPVLSPPEKAIMDQLRGLRSLADDVRATTTMKLAIDIRNLPASANKLRLADGLANLSTEGDFGHQTLQEVATTLAQALQEQPPGQGAGEKSGEIPEEYLELASLAKYENVLPYPGSPPPQYLAAMRKLEADDQRRAQADFTLKDLNGKEWSLRSLRGKVVLVNFWATWCPPCRKEMPDLETLYEQARDQGFIVLAISDEDAAKVRPFIAERNITYPVLLDPGRKVNTLFAIDGIPKSFVYDRDGRLAAEAIDMRTRNQFLEMMMRAGLQTETLSTKPPFPGGTILPRP